MQVKHWCDPEQSVGRGWKYLNHPEEFKEWAFPLLFRASGQDFIGQLVIVVQSLSHVWLFVIPWTAARQASVSSTIS